MPQYTVSTRAPLTAEQRSALAKRFMDTHCGITGAPQTFVVVHYAHGVPLNEGRSVHVFGNVRKGRTPELCMTLSRALTEQICSCLEIPVARLELKLFEVPASWVMEGGEVLPEPGEEALSEWLRRERRA